MGMAEGGGDASAAASEMKLEFTPTWIVAAVCSLIVFISLVVERLLHRLGKVLKRKNQKPLFEALQKVKEELMLLGFISLLLTVFQGAIQRICIPKGWTLHMLPCKKEEPDDAHGAATEAHFQAAFSAGLFGGRRLLSESGSGAAHCLIKGKVPLLSLEAIHQLHIFIFVLAITHVAFSVLTILLGGAKIHQWKHWEDSIQKQITGDGTAPKQVTHVHQFEFIRDRFRGIGAISVIISWLHSFVKQFFGSVTKSDYTTMRLGFIMTHCKGNPKFDFHKYMIRALEADFKKVVGISWYLWVFVVIFLLLNVNGWHTYFWIAFIPLILLLALGTKLEHVITQLAQEVAEKHTAIEGDLVVKPSDDHFWFHRPQIVLYLIHFILFQNAFEIAFFFWIFTTYGYNSCIMDHVCFIVPRLVIGVTIQLLCSYSTLPLYAIVTQMGSYFKKAIFDEHVQEGLVGWAEKVKKRKGLRIGNGLPTSHAQNETTTKVELPKMFVQTTPAMEEGRSSTGEIASRPAT
ncbi:MLO-like protein 1 [Musa acuminata AAA Group]|uniref:MLO-like protein 1 n=1 Tax=Musa acuminata AAA Group TaxID=214697 RepID=UPI0031D6A013